MANAMYGKGRNKFARGDIKWLATGGDTFKVFLIDSASYTPVMDTHEFLSDVASGSRKGNSGGNTIASAPTLTLIDPVLGVCDANNVTFTGVPVGDPLEYILIFKSTGVESTSPLIALIDTASSGLPVTPNGGDIVISWDDGANKIFKL